MSQQALFAVGCVVFFFVVAGIFSYGMAISNRADLREVAVQRGRNRPESGDAQPDLGS